MISFIFYINGLKKKACGEPAIKMKSSGLRLIGGVNVIPNRHFNLIFFFQFKKDIKNWL